MGQTNKKLNGLLIIILLLILPSLVISVQIVVSDQNLSENTLTPDTNNSFSEAVQLSNNTTVTGSVNIDNDPYDYYKVALRRVGWNADYLQINVTVTDILGGILLTLFNPERYIIGKDTVITSIRNPLYRAIHACYGGFYYIRIEANPLVAINTNYAITVNWTMKMIITDNDNTNSTARPVSSGSYLSFLGPETDYLDLYNVSLVVGENTTEGIEATLSDVDNLYLAVFKPDGTLRMMSDYTALDDEDDEKIKFAADQTGNYRIAAGISSAPAIPIILYYLNITIVSGIPPDSDYSEEFATRVYNGTQLNAAFGSDFDVFDFYVIELNQSDNLTVSILYTDGGPGDLDIDIYELDRNPINNEIHYKKNKGVWTWCIANKDSTDYYIKVQNMNLSRLVNYSILFSLTGDNLWFKPVQSNNTNLDFSMLEDTVDESHVNLTHIFFDPDSPITLNSPSHPNGQGANIDMEILKNGTVKFSPHQDFFGFEIFNFSATDEKDRTLFWEVNVTVLPVNDPPILDQLDDQLWTQDKTVGLKLTVTDVDDTKFGFTDNTPLFDIDAQNRSINFTPRNDQVGLYSINISVSDGDLSDSIDFDLEIKNINDPPEFLTIGNISAYPGGFIELIAYEDEFNQYNVLAKDIDHDVGIMDVLAFSLNTTDPAFNIDELTGNFSFTPEQKHVGLQYITIRVDDGLGGISKHRINITVIDAPDPPTTPIFKVGITNLTAEFTITDVYDEDGDVLTFIWDFGDGTNLTTQNYSAQHEYTSPGTYNITLIAQDNNGAYSSNWQKIDLVWKPDNNDTNGTGDNNKTFIDTDNDDLDDNWELEHFGSLSHGIRDGDFDGDGYTNYEEFIAGTDPTKKTDRPFDGNDKTDTSDDDYEDTSNPSSLVLLFAALGLIIFIVLLFSFLVFRKRSKKDTGDDLAKYDDLYIEEPGHYCPECDEPIDIDDLECPNCGFDLDDYDFTGYYEPEINDFDYQGKPRVSPRRRFYKGSGPGRGKTSTKSKRRQRKTVRYRAEDDTEYDDDNDSEFEDEYDNEDEYEYDNEDEYSDEEYEFDEDLDGIEDEYGIEADWNMDDNDYDDYGDDEYDEE